MKTARNKSSGKSSASKTQKLKAIQPRIRFECTICSKLLSSEQYFIKHLDTHAPKDYLCDNCGRHFKNKNTLRLHMLNHRKHYRVKCKVCGSSYITHQSMRKHLRTHFEQHQCDECGKVFRHKNLLQNHIMSFHVDQPSVPCNYCTRLFNCAAHRDAHQKLIHPDRQLNIERFKCPNCPLGFEMREELRIHSFIHFNGEIHTCTECHQIFKKKKSLQFHMMMHESPGFRCETCNKVFKYKSNLGKHKREKRCRPEKPGSNLVGTAEEAAAIAKEQFIKMTVAPRKIENKLNTKKEVEEEILIKIKTENEEILKVEKAEKPEIMVKIEPDTPKKRVYIKKKPIKLIKLSTIPYECDLCDFVCQKKCQILSHIRGHISATRHKCKNCPETFSTKLKLHFHSMKAHGRGIIGSVEYSKAVAACHICHQIFSEERLKYHLKLHEGPSFECSQCRKIFRTESAIEKHLANSHENEKRFTCATCGKSFAKMTVLRQHEEVHNPIKIYVQCEICNALMLVKSLKLHMAMKHSEKYQEKRHVCHCGKAFRYQKQLEKHCNSVHMKTSRGYVYVCPDCEAVFNRREDLREHSFTHYQGKVFTCECGMKFKKRKLLTIHEAIHKNIKFPCDFCSMTFQTRGGRRKHHAKVHGQAAEEVVEIPSYDIVDAEQFGDELKKENVF